MPKADNDELLNRLLAIFRVEASEHLENMAAQLQTLAAAANAEARAEVLESLFREAHSLKGAARSVNLPEIEAICMGLESSLAELRRQPPETLPAEWFPQTERTLDELAALLSADKTSTVAPPPAAPATALPTAPAAPPTTVKAPPTLPAGGDTVRIATSRLKQLQIQAEELLAYKFSAAHRIDELHALHAELAERRKAWGRLRQSGQQAAAVRPSGPEPGLPPAIVKLLDAVRTEEETLKALSERLRRLESQARHEQRTLAGLVDNLQGDIRQALMLPFANLLELFPKLVRDLARDSGKEAELVSSGPMIEVDRQILEQMKDPLIHLMRNAIDHGIEAPAERRRVGKPALGRIALELTPREGNRLELTISDDGGGVSLDKVRAAAVKLGLHSAEAAAALTPPEVLALLFESGLSTSPILTELSGRGLGLAIVREKVEKLGGSIQVETPAGGGTLFRLQLPTSLATFHGLLVMLGERPFVLPSRSVERVSRLTADSIKTLENREAVEIGGQALALVLLADVLGLPAVKDRRTDSEDQLQIVVLSGAGRRIAFVVDRILGDREVLVKGLGPQLRRVRYIAGATLLGTGQLAPILNVADLLLGAARVRPDATASTAAAAAAEQPTRSLLVVEDSITARSLLKSILESAGYQVATAVDGMDALSLLRTEHFDLVISDVEMPRLDGFELTARIRANRRLADLPVVLVTALESREDKEHGIEVGANAYIVKSSFDQSNLFEVIRRLI